MKTRTVMTFSVLAMLNAVSAWAQPAPAASQRSVNAAELPKVFAVRASVADLGRAERFYKDGLGATQVVKVNDRERAVQFASGVNVILVQGPARAADAAVTPIASGFILQVTDLMSVVKRVPGAGGVVVRAPNPDAPAGPSGVRAAMVQDPDGLSIELIEFPAAR
jgi:predicted enzyme related to lactoylglutathione lyase